MEELKVKNKKLGKEWQEIKVEDLKAPSENALATGPFGSSIGSRFFQKEGVPVIRGSNLSADMNVRINDEGLVFVSKEKALEFKRSIVRKGDLIFTCWGTINQVGLIDENSGYSEYVISNKQMKFTPDPSKASSLFLYYLFSGFELQNFIKNQSIGSSVPGFNLGQFRSIILKIPPMDEQRAITSALSDVDSLLTALDSLIAKKRLVKQGAMQELLTGKRRLSGFSGKWGVQKLGSIIEIIRSGIYGDEKSNDGKKPFRVATTAHIELGDTWNKKEMAIRYFREEDIKKYSPVNGDLLVVKSSGSAEKIQSGKIGYIDTSNAGNFVFSNFLMLLRPKGIKPKFLYYYLTSYNVKKLLPNLVEASTYPNIRIDEYLDLDIPFPLEKEQTAIAEILSDIDAEINALESRREKTRQLKTGMMQELLTGRIRLLS